jgi:Barstar (barnase inhibitor)
MQVVTRAIPVDEIQDWPTFHDVFQRAMDFPSFYGRNMDAWVDCMTSLDAPEDGMTTVSVDRGGLPVLEVDNAPGFERKCPEQYRALLECTAFVNFRRREVGEAPVLALLLIGTK